MEQVIEEVCPKHASENTRVCVCLLDILLFPLFIYPGVELLDHMADLFLIF